MALQSLEFAPKKFARHTNGSPFSGMAVRKSEIAASGPLVPAFEGSRQRPEGSASNKVE